MRLRDYLEAFAGFVLLAICIGIMYVSFKQANNTVQLSLKEFQCTKVGLIADKPKCLAYEFIEK